MPMNLSSLFIFEKERIRGGGESSKLKISTTTVNTFYLFKKSILALHRKRVHKHFIKHIHYNKTKIRTGQDIVPHSKQLEQ